MIAGSSRRAVPASLGSLLFPAGQKAPGVDAALVAVRIVLAWIFVYYGAGKLFGAFNGPGIHATSEFFSDTAHLHPGGFFAVLAGVIELGGGIAVALGLFSRLAGLALFGDQVVAMITVTWAGGIGSLTGKTGYEFNLVLAVLALVVVLLGSGRASADHLVSRRLLAGRPRDEGASGSPAPGRSDADPLPDGQVTSSAGSNLPD